MDDVTGLYTGLIGRGVHEHAFDDELTVVGEETDPDAFVAEVDGVTELFEFFFSEVDGIRITQGFQHAIDGIGHQLFFEIVVFGTEIPVAIDDVDDLL